MQKPNTGNEPTKLIDQDEHVEQAARALKAMSHPLRLKILCVLGDQEVSVQDIVDRTVAQGAQLLTGGTHQGLFFQPTVLSGVTADMPAFADEIFGPVAPITVFDTEEEAVALVNASPYGLAAAIHSANVSRAMAVANQLHTGMIHINDQTVNNEFHVPFGGMGASGNGGRFGGPANLDEFTQTQWVSVMDQPIVYPF